MAIEEKLLKIQVKVYEPSDRNNAKTITLKKTNTIKELVDMIKKEVGDSFCDGGVLDGDFRLRYFDTKIKKCYKIYEDAVDIKTGQNPYERTLMHQGIFSYYPFKIELKKDGQFEEYNENWIYLRVIKWDGEV